MSTIGSTASFDKHPQSQERGITIDLGFSCFQLEDGANVTLVDCPGHASLLKTVLSGAGIIDAAILVLDSQKGIQMQTAECLMLAEIFGWRLFVILNKVDLIEDEGEKVGKIKEQLRKISLKCNLEIISFSEFSTVSNTAFYLEKFKAELSKSLFSPNRKTDEKFLMASDHCFPIKGKGTVLTGTVLQGICSVGQTVQIGTSSMIRKVKSIQCFRKDLRCCKAGNRVALLFSDVDASQFERSLIFEPGLVCRTKRLLLAIKQISHFRGLVKNGQKLHITVLNDTKMATVTFYQRLDDGEFLVEPSSTMTKNSSHALLEFDQEINYVDSAIVLASKLDLNVDCKTCRFVFYSKEAPPTISSFRSFRWKEKWAQVDRFHSSSELIGKGLTKTPENLSHHLGRAIEIYFKDTHQLLTVGILASTFGSTGKFKVSHTNANFFDTYKPGQLQLRLRYRKYSQL